MPAPDIFATSLKLSDFITNPKQVKPLENKPQPVESNANRLENDQDIHTLLCWAY